MIGAGGASGSAASRRGGTGAAARQSRHTPPRPDAAWTDAPPSPPPAPNHRLPLALMLGPPWPSHLSTSPPAVARVDRPASSEKSLGPHYLEGGSHPTESQPHPPWAHMGGTRLLLNFPSPITTSAMPLFDIQPIPIHTAAGPPTLLPTRLLRLFSAPSPSPFRSAGRTTLMRDMYHARCAT